MDFGQALQAMKEGKKVRLPELPKNYWIVADDISWGGMSPLYKDIILVKGNIKKWESLKLCWRILNSEEWEIVEDIKTAEVHTTTWYKCPYCKYDLEVPLRFGEIIKCQSCHENVKLVWEKTDTIDLGSLLKQYAAQISSVKIY